MLACPRLVLAATLAASPATSTPAAAGTCPNERADAGADANLGNCLGDAREARRANELRLAAAAYARALMFAREAYTTGKTGPAWNPAAGEQIVHYGTEGCALATNLGGDAPRALLTACIALLDEFLADLAASDADASRSLAAAQQRRAELEPLLAGLPDPEPAPVAPATTTPATPASESPAAPPQPRPGPIPPPRRPTGLDAGLGVSAAVAGLAIVGLVVGDQVGRKAHATALSGPDPAAGVDVCEAMPSTAGCDDLRSARRLFVASGITLGVALAATAVFTGLRIRHARRARSTTATVSWYGPRAGLTVHF